MSVYFDKYKKFQTDHPNIFKEGITTLPELRDECNIRLWKKVVWLMLPVFAAFVCISFGLVLKGLHAVWEKILHCWRKKIRL